MFLLCICDIQKKDKNLPYPGDSYTNDVMGMWFSNINGSRAFYYILFAQYLRD